jgi:hypothetical protein
LADKSVAVTTQTERSVRQAGPPSVARDSIRLPCVYYFFLAVVVIRYNTTATARWALLFIVRAFFNDTITVAVWTGFHVRLMEMLHTPAINIRWCVADPVVAFLAADRMATVIA